MMLGSCTTARLISTSQNCMIVSVTYLVNIGSLGARRSDVRDDAIGIVQKRALDRVWACKVEVRKA